jgi:predicted CopG family antitoxin
MKAIKVSEQVHKELNELKEENGHTSFDSAIRELLYKAKDE